MTTLSEVRDDLLRAGPQQNPTLDILVVDDSIIFHRMMAYRFQLLNWTMTSVHNGKEAVELFQKNGFKDYDMVLMDKEMPVMGGEAATKMLIKMGCKTPIIALTSHSHDSFAMTGVLGILSKPLQIPKLLHVLLDTLKKKSKSQQAVEKKSEMLRGNPDARNWTKEEVCCWLASLGPVYEMYTSSLLHHGINGKMLLLCLDLPFFYGILGVINPLHITRINMGILELKKKMKQILHEQEAAKDKKQQQKERAARAASSSSGAIEEEPIDE